LKELKVCLHELSIVDDTLKALGVPKKYQRLRNWIIRIIIGWIVYFLFDSASNICLSFMYYPDDNVIEEIYPHLVINYPTYVNISSALICQIVLRYTNSRFHQVNDRLLVFISSDLFKNNEDYRKQNRFILIHQHIAKFENRKQSIWILM
ncbi:hypothetical protein ALC53_13505, partial [Atta colombica]